MSCGIYKITNTINNKSYIGQSINIESRWTHHKNYNNQISDYPLYKAFQKYGMENFTFEIIEQCNAADLDSKEIYWIDYYDSYYNGYNQTTGGQSGNSNAIIKISKEEIQIIYDLLLNSNKTQKEIAKMFSVGEDTISEINQGKTRRNEKLTYPLRQNRKEKHFCIDCGIEVYYTAIRCNNCNKIHNRTVERPTREELKQLIRTKPFTQIGKQFGVSDNAIRKWCDAENLPRKATEIKAYSDKEWELI